MNDELTKAIEALDEGKFDNATWSVIKKALGKGDESWTAGQQQELLDKFRDFAYHTPEGRRAVQDKLRETSTQRFTKEFKPFFKSILNGVDVATSLGQIKSSNRALQSIVEPGIASSPGVNPEVDAQLYNAQSTGAQEAARALAPAQMENEQQYQNDLNLAKQISGGNAGAFQSNAQSASFRKQRAAAQYPAIQDAIRARYQQRADQLALGKGQLLQQDFGNRLYASQLALDQYNRKMAAAGALGQAGRLNLRNSLEQIPDNIAGIVGQVTSLPKSQPHGYPIVNSSSPVGPPTQAQFDASQYGPLFEDYAAKVHNGLQKTFTDLYSSPNPSYIP